MQGKLAAALKHFEAAVKMNPLDHMNFYKRATAHMIEKKYAAAIKDLTKTLELKPGYTQALDKRARVYALEGKFSLATEDLNTLLRAKPGDGELKERLAKVTSAKDFWHNAQRWMAEGNWRAALENLNALIDVASDSVEMLLARTQCYKSLGDLENVLVRCSHLCVLQFACVCTKIQLSHS